MSTLFWIENIYAQSKSDGVIVNIILHPIQTITINSSQKSVNLQYLNREDYDKGVSATLNDHLSVTSTGAFQVNVVAGSENFLLNGNQSALPVSDIMINASNVGDNGNAYTFNNVVLSTVAESLIISERGGIDLKYNVTYDNSIAGSSGAYEGNYATSGNDELLFSAVLTYSITPK